MMRDRQRWLRYVLALAVVGVAVLVRVALVPVMGLNVPYVTIYPAIMIVAVVFGTGPGVLAALLGIALAEYHFMRPEGVIAWDLSLAVRSMLVLGASLYIGRIGQKLRAACAQAETRPGWRARPKKPCARARSGCVSRSKRATPARGT
jgi:K+-sensing histidine kinase KdpD